MSSPDNSQSFIEEDYGETVEVQDQKLTGGAKQASITPLVFATAIFLCSVVAFAIGAFYRPQSISSFNSTLSSPSIHTPSQFERREDTISQMSTLSTRITSLEESLYKLTRDNIAKPDFALRYIGAEVNLDLTTKVPETPVEHGPVRALDDNTGVGRCWHIPQSHGQLGIKLAGQIFISEITVDHAAKELISSVTSAPRRMIVWGICPQLHGVEFPFFKSQSTSETCEIRLSTSESVTIGNRRAPSMHDRQKYVPIASFEYNIQAVSPIQTFPVFQSIAIANMTFSEVVLEILDNWGSMSTCLYRVRVHGELR